VPKVSILFARFPYGGNESYQSANWMIETIVKAKADPRICSVDHMEVNDTPITMSRNRVLKACLDRKIDLVCMLDSDMHPDLYKGTRNAVPFWDTSLDFVLNHDGPSVIGAPYCGPPPVENIYVFRWANQQSDHPNPDLKIEQYSREEAAVRTGIEEVAALPTGLILIDMRAISRLKPAWFDYEYEDPPFNTKKATTEDVFFTRNLSLAGVPQYVNWSAWAGHIKQKTVGMPQFLGADQVRKEFRDALTRPAVREGRLVDVSPANGFGESDAERRDARRTGRSRRSQVAE